MSNKKFMKKKDLFRVKVYKISVIVTLIGLLTLITGTSYAILKGTTEAANEQVIKAGNVTLKLTENFESINKGIAAMSDTEGLLQSENYVFNIKNVGSIGAKYDLKIVNEVPSDYKGEVLPLKYIKVGLEINGEEYGPFNLGEKEGIIDSNTIYKNEIINYKLRMWIDKEKEEELKNMTEYKAFLKLKVEAEQRSDRKTYEVKYNANGGKGEMDSGTFKYGKRYRLEKNTFTKEGYEFIGWSTNPTSETIEYTDEEEVINIASKEEKEITLYAIWQQVAADEYTIKYILGGESVTGNPTKYTKDTETITLKNPTKTGYTFLGWTGSNGDVPSLTVTIEKGSTGNREYTANWKAKTYVISSLDTHGVGIGEMQVTYGENKITNFKKPERKYTITFNANNQGATISSLNSINYEYEFDGFYTDSETKLIYANGNLLPNVEGYTDSEGRWIKDADVALEDKWKGDDVLPESKPVITLPTVEKENNVCYWGLKADSTTGYTSGGKIEDVSTLGSRTLYALCQPNPYTATFNKNGASSVGSEVLSCRAGVGGNSCTVTAPSITAAAGYTVVGYASKADATTSEVNVGDTITLTGDKTYYAITKKDINITYNANGGSGAPNADNGVLYNNKATSRSVTISSTKPTKTGHTFLGYSTSKTATTATYNVGETYDFTASTTLYAVWQANQYTITYNSNGGTGCSGTKTVTYGKAIGELCTPTKADNYMFVGWYDSSTAKQDSTKAYKDHPWLYYADKYSSLYSSYGYDEAKLFNDYYTNVINGTQNRRSSQYLSEDIYNIAGDTTLYAGWYKMWEGIPKGTYTAGNTITYAGKEWTVVKDNGNNVGLALNGTTGYGAYKTDVQSNLNNSVVNNDAKYGGIVKQSSGSYVSTASGTSKNLTIDDGVGVNYWTDSTHFYNRLSRKHYTTVSHKYRSGWKTNWSSELQPLSVRTLADTINSSVAASAGIVSKSGTYYNESNGKITVTNGSYTSSKAPAPYYYSKKYQTYDFKNISGVSSGNATSKKLMYHKYQYNVENDGSSTVIEETQLTSTYMFVVYICGGDNAGQRNYYKANSAASFKYASEATGYGWNGSSFSDADAILMSYNGDSGHWKASFAGGASASCTNKCAATGDCTSCTYSSSFAGYYRAIKNNTHSSCMTPTVYEVKDISFYLYYRPYIIVRER